MNTVKRSVVEAITLSTSRGRLAFWAVITTAVYLAPYSLLGNLSIWQRLGLDWAPSIGLTRAYWLVLHGNFPAAWVRNPLIFLVLGVGIPLLLIDAIKVYRQLKAKPIQ